MPTNQDRAQRCDAAIRVYYDDEPAVNLTDILCDSMHWCDANGEDFGYLLAVACRHYVNELNDEQTDERRLSNE